MFGKTGSGANIGKLKKDVAAGTRDVDSVSVLILELDAPPPTSGYAVRTVNHRQQVGQNEWKVIDDWTPGQTASAASRHYITAGGNELQELANYLAVVCPRIKRLLTGKEEEAGEPTNTLTLTSSGATGQSMLPDLRFGEGAASKILPAAAPAFPTAAASTAKGTGEEDKEGAMRQRMDAVHATLRSVGVKDPQSCSCCVKRAILDGHIDLSSWQRFTCLQALSFGLVLGPDRLGADSAANALPAEVVSGIVAHLNSLQRKPLKRVLKRAGELANPLDQVLVEDGSCPR
jgi:hypothetical protein